MGCLGLQDSHWRGWVAAELFDSFHTLALVALSIPTSKPGHQECALQVSRVLPWPFWLVSLLAELLLHVDLHITIMMPTLSCWAFTNKKNQSSSASLPAAAGSCTPSAMCETLEFTYKPVDFYITWQKNFPALNPSCQVFVAYQPKSILQRTAWMPSTVNTRGTKNP